MKNNYNEFKLLNSEKELEEALKHMEKMYNKYLVTEIESGARFHKILKEIDSNEKTKYKFHISTIKTQTRYNVYIVKIFTIINYAIETTDIASDTASAFTPAVRIRDSSMYSIHILNYVNKYIYFSMESLFIGRTNCTTSKITKTRKEALQIVQQIKNDLLSQKLNEITKQYSSKYKLNNGE